jgi:tetratricopeptide (TPR) repeat protein
VAVAEGDLLRAAHHFEKMAVSAARGSIHRQAIAAYDHGLVLLQLRRWLDGIRRLDAAIALFTQDADPYREGLAHWATGTALLRMGDYHAAGRSYERASHLLRGHPSAAYPRFGALICASMMDTPYHSVSLELTTLAGEAPPALRPRIHHFIGTLRRLSGHAGQALEWLDQALADEPPGTELWCDTQCERLLCLCLTGALSEASLLWDQVADHWGVLDAANTTAMAVMGMLFDKSCPPEPFRNLAPMHHEHRVEAVMEWAWHCRQAGTTRPK